MALLGRHNAGSTSTEGKGKKAARGTGKACSHLLWMPTSLASLALTGLGLYVFYELYKASQDFEAINQTNVEHLLWAPMTAIFMAAVGCFFLPLLAFMILLKGSLRGADHSYGFLTGLTMGHSMFLLLTGMVLYAFRSVVYSLVRFNENTGGDRRHDIYKATWIICWGLAGIYFLLSLIMMLLAKAFSKRHQSDDDYHSANYPASYPPAGSQFATTTVPHRETVPGVRGAPVVANTAYPASSTVAASNVYTVRGSNNV